VNKNQSKEIFGHTGFTTVEDDCPNEHPLYGDNKPELEKEEYLAEMRKFIAQVKTHESYAEWITEARFVAQGEDRVEFDKALELWGTRILAGFNDYSSFNALINLCKKYVPEEECDSEEDMVNSPDHYADAPIECIDAMTHCFGIEEVQIYAKIAAFKYLWRSKYKHTTDAQDLAKAEWYIRFANGTSGSPMETIHGMNFERRCPS
jgi:hypothetical protein